MRAKLILLFFILVGIIIFFSFQKLPTGLKRKITAIVPEKVKETIEPNYYNKVPSYLVNDSLHYFVQKNKIIKQKKQFKTTYLKAKTTSEKTKILENASNFLYQNLTDSLIPYWYGTAWDYNGISQKPGKGKIACGYFVFTLLRDAGFRLPRVKMSQAASEQAIKSLVNSKQINRYSNISLEEFITKIKTKGNGIYIVGLDNHVGLYQVKNEESWFCHSTVIYPSCVIKEKAAYSPALQYSSYRVVGKLSDYETLTKQWLLNEYINLK